MKYSSDTDGFRLVVQYLNQLQYHVTHVHQCGTVLIAYAVSGRKKEVGVNQKFPVATLYKSRNVPSVLFFTNPEMSRRYFVQIKITAVTARISKMCKTKLIF